MNIVKRLYESAKTALTPKRKASAAKALPQTAPLSTATARDLPVLSPYPVRSALQPDRAGMPSTAEYGSMDATGGRSLVYAPAAIDAAAVSDALCTQCRRYANDIAAQEVL